MKNSKKLSMVIALALVFGSAVSLRAMGAQEEHKDKNQATVVGCAEQLELSDAEKAEKIKQANALLFEGLGLNADLNKVVSALKAGADVNCVDLHTGNTPLIDAVEYGHLSIVKTLVLAGAEYTNSKVDSLLPNHVKLLKKAIKKRRTVKQDLAVQKQVAQVLPDLLPKELCSLCLEYAAPNIDPVLVELLKRHVESRRALHTTTAQE